MCMVYTKKKNIYSLTLVQVKTNCAEDKVESELSKQLLVNASQLNKNCEMAYGTLKKLISNLT